MPTLTKKERICMISKLKSIESLSVSTILSLISSKDWEIFNSSSIEIC